MKMIQKDFMSQLIFALLLLIEVAPCIVKMDSSARIAKEKRQNLYEVYDNVSLKCYYQLDQFYPVCYFVYATATEQMHFKSTSKSIENCLIFYQILKSVKINLYSKFIPIMMKYYFLTNQTLKIYSKFILSYILNKNKNY